MTLVNKEKIKKKLREEAQTKKLFLLTKKEELFSKKPPSLRALYVTGIGVFDVAEGLIKKRIEPPFPVDLHNSLKIRSWLRRQPVSKAILDYVEQELNDELVAEVILKCERGEVLDEDFTAKPRDIFKSIQSSGDLVNKTSKKKNVAEKLIRGTNAKDVAKTIHVLTYFVVVETKKLFSESEFPPIYRTKYLQKLLRTVKIVIAGSVRDTSDEYTKLEALISSIDTVVISLLGGVGTYLLNRVKLQKRATQFVKEISCIDLPEPSDPLVTPIPYKEILACPTENDNVIVPKEPFFLKQQNVRCEVTEIQETKEIETKSKQELADRAVVDNLTSKKFKIDVNIGKRVSDETIIGTLGQDRIFSPVGGTVYEIRDNQVWIKDLTPDGPTFLERSIENLGTLYKEHNETKEFLRNFQIYSWYPIMLSSTPDIDPSLNLAGNPVFLGVRPQFDRIKKEWKDTNTIYENRVRVITNKDNVKKHAKNETTHKIKEDIEKQHTLLNRYRSLLSKRGINNSRVSRAKKEEFSLIEYYMIELGVDLNGIEEPNEIQIQYRDQINFFIEQRIVIDSFRPELIERKINDLIKKLSLNPITGSGRFKEGVAIFNQTKKINNVRSWVQSIADKNPRLNDFQKSQLTNQIVYLYQLYFRLNKIKANWANLRNSSKKEALIREASFIQNYFDGLEKRMVEIPKEIKKLEKRIEELSLVSVYSLFKDKGEEYRRYSIIDTDVQPCGKTPVEKTITKFDDIKYWIRWCSGATLSSTISPGIGWATGLLTPAGPVQLPTVYIPVKPIASKWGFVLLGLTITGMWVYPLVLFVNYETKYNLPLGDPTKPLKKRITNLKKKLNSMLKEFRVKTLQLYLDDASEKIGELQTQVNKLKQKQAAHKKKKPKKKKSIEYVVWDKTNLEIEKDVTELEVKVYTLELKFQQVYRAQTLGTSITGGVDPVLVTIEKQEEAIEESFEALDALTDTLSNTLATLPVAMDPASVNFGFTPKNPKPINLIADELDDTVNQTMLDLSLATSFINPELMMAKVPNFDDTVLNFKEYKKKLESVSLLTVKKDPFPTYEKMKPTNLKWIGFLTTQFVPKGAQTFGIPGFPPFPIK